VGTHRVADRKRLGDDFVTGYAQILRPHLVIGRFRGPGSEPGQFLTHVSQVAERADVTWAVTGAPAAYVLDRFYRTDEIPLFVTAFPPTLSRSLTLVPDRQGPVTVLRAFGARWMWRRVERVPVAHPWLVYAELLYGGEPRALEAAEQLRQRYLTS
jgi:hypothetical protein